MRTERSPRVRCQTLETTRPSFHVNPPNVHTAWCAPNGSTWPRYSAKATVSVAIPPVEPATEERGPEVEDGEDQGRGPAPSLGAHLLEEPADQDDRERAERSAKENLRVRPRESPFPNFSLIESMMRRAGEGKDDERGDVNDRDKQRDTDDEVNDQQPGVEPGFFLAFEEIH